jgi:hypothetical protein
MNHQIALVGGQLIPVYVGIKEFTPDRVHFIVSDESVGSLSILKPLLSSTKWVEYKCNPFDFISIKSICEKIISKLKAEDTITFNLTGGTKIMVLACQALIHEKGLNGFYINQDYSFLELPAYNKKQLTTQLSIQNFFDLSDHHLFSSNRLEDFTKEDFAMALAIEMFANNGKLYTAITGHMRRKYDNASQPIPEKGKEVLLNNIVFSWDSNTIIVNLNGRPILNLKSKHIKELFFNAAWWELLVAKEISNWAGLQEMLVNCVLPFKTDKLTSKNEIDILVSTGNRLIFVECKSGNVRQEDINKMKVIKQTYGGVIAKSILVSRFLPNATILEKCKELDIDVFYTHVFRSKQINPLKKLIVKLNEINRKPSI